MKTITIPGWVQDNTGSYHKPGATLTVSEKEAAGCIDAKRAKQIAGLKAATSKRRPTKAKRRADPRPKAPPAVAPSLPAAVAPDAD